jgi:hypothetical protein
MTNRTPLRLILLVHGNTSSTITELDWPVFEIEVAAAKLLESGKYYVFTVRLQAFIVDHRWLPNLQYPSRNYTLTRDNFTGITRDGYEYPVSFDHD